MLPDARQQEPRAGLLTLQLHPQQAQLDEEEFVELQPPACRLQQLLRLGEVDLLQRLGVGHELGAPQERGRQGLGELSPQQLLERVEQLAHLSARQPDAPHSLREGIDGHEPRAYSLLLLRIIQLGMRDAVAAREGYGLAKDEEHTPLGIEPADGR